MVSLHLLSVFIGALVVVYALPGPDMALVLQTSTSKGIRQGLATACGLAIARTTHVTLSACGVAALLRGAPWLYSAVRILGALYLAYIAIQIFRSPGFGIVDATAPHHNNANNNASLRSAVLKGMLSSLLNPKALLFCSVLLPQFVHADAGPVWSQVLELGVVLVVIGVAFDLAFTFGAARIASWLRTSPRAQTMQRWTFSAALMAFALRLSME